MCGILCLICSGGKIDQEMARNCLEKLTPRGPDREKDVCFNHSEVGIYFGFKRLAIMDTTDAGLQPFELNGNVIVCNGEIYNYKSLANENKIELKSGCDCEILLPLSEKIGFDAMTDDVNAEFAMVMYDKKSNCILAARDRFGVRPLFYGYNTVTGMIGFASEMKALHDIMEFVMPVKPNQICKIDLDVIHLRNLNKNDIHPKHLIKFSDYYDYSTSLMAVMRLDNLDYIKTQIRYLFTNAVEKRLMADREIGFLLSGGLDSSLVVAIATKILGPDKIVCFSIGLPGSPDVEAAIKVTSYLGIKQHYIVPFDIETGLKVIRDVIRALESYDITTIRASTPQFMMADYIMKNTSIRVLLSGEGSDELCGSYRYFRDAPNAVEFHWETVRLLQDLYCFDNLRTDRTMAHHGLEVRVPFLDFDYVEFVARINPQLLMFTEQSMEKQILRDSFKDGDYLPAEILYRSKEAFSDGVSSKETNWFKSIQSLANELITDEELLNNPFEINKPETKEALYFRRIFNEIYPNRDSVIPYYWLPRFQKEKVVDPSATVLKCY